MSTKDFLEKDYYKTLGVPKDAPADAVKKAYRKLARTHHPDANKGDPAAEERFKEISEAYDVLSDAKRRADYDEARTLFGAGAGRFRTPTGGGMGGTGGVPFDLGDVFGGGAGGLGDVLGGLFGTDARAGRAGRAGRASAARRGADMESQVALSFSDAVTGTTVSLRMASEQSCPTCKGTGSRSGSLPHQCPVCLGTGQTSRNAGGFAFAEPCRVCRGRGLVVDDPCPDCGGSGRAMGTRTLTARIPAGVRDGQRIRLKGKGGPGERGGPAGDLYVVVSVTSHPLFGRSADNLTLTVPVSFAEAALGGAVTVPTLSGATVTLRLPSGTANGRTFRVRGKGVSRKDGTAGDLLVTVQVAVPAKLSREARSAVEAFRDATGGEDPRAGLFDGRPSATKGG